MAESQGDCSRPMDVINVDEIISARQHQRNKLPKPSTVVDANLVEYTKKEGKLTKIGSILMGLQEISEKNTKPAGNDFECCQYREIEKQQCDSL